MIKYLAIPLILVGCTAPVTDPPAHACSPRLDGQPTFCPDPHFDDIKLKPLNLENHKRGEIDIWNPHHFIHMEQMFIRNARRNEIEKNMTQPDDAINKALMEYLNGSNGSTEQKEAATTLE
ncbi:MAG: hypothetical protein CM15mL3_0990 [Kanaloavirus sp.]|nr:MAG: hypothetical protein CM15mL3_0990 [Kanaloavirus sp.]